MPNESHGDPRNLTTLQLRGAADAAGISVPQAVGNMVHSLSLWRGRQKAAQKAQAEPIAEGTVLKADDENRFLLLVAYSANKMPQRGADGFIDVARPSVLEKAAWRFMDNGARIGLWHEPGHEGAARVVENYIYRNDIPWVMTAPNGEEQVIKAGDWVVGVICDPPTWRLYKSGRIGGASPQGSAGRRVADSAFLNSLRS